MISYCFLVPHYNHYRQFAEFLPQLQAQGLHCIIVDDGSDREQIASLRDLLNAQDNVSLVEHEQNRGKGAAVMTGMNAAAAQGFSHVIQVDADGQHDVKDVPAFIALSRSKPDCIISGLPVFDESVPAVRYWGRKLTHGLARLEACSGQIRDAMCGFRVYPLNVSQQVLANYKMGEGMDFDAEFLVKASWNEGHIDYVETRVHYTEQGVSHFHYLGDNVVMVLMHTRLIVGMLLRLPMLFLNAARRARTDTL